MENEITGRLRAQANRMERIIHLAKEKNHTFTENDAKIVSDLENAIADYIEILDEENH